MAGIAKHIKEKRNETIEISAFKLSYGAVYQPFRAWRYA